MVTSDSRIQDRDHGARPIQTEIRPDVIDAHRGHRLVHVGLGQPQVLDHHHAGQSAHALGIEENLEGYCRCHGV